MRRPDSEPVLVAGRIVCQLARISVAARRPDLTAPSMYPFHTSEVSAPAQWIRPAGAASAIPYWVQAPAPNRGLFRELIDDGAHVNPAVVLAD